MPHTPKPWEVEKDMDLFGRYTILEAAKENSDWIYAGYDISDVEGDRRGKESEEINEANRLLIQTAPDLFDFALLVADAYIGPMSAKTQLEAIQKAARVLVAKVKGE